MLTLLLLTALLQSPEGANLLTSNATMAIVKAGEMPDLPPPVFPLTGFSGQVTEPPLKTGYVQWVYTDAQVTAGQVVLFSLCVDAITPCTQVKLADVKTTVMSWYEWKLPPLLVGEHAVTVQACNPSECSSSLGAKFTLRLTPDPVSGVRVGGGQ